MIREPQLPGLRVPVEADRVAHALYVILDDPGLGIDPRNRCLEVGRHDDVAARADVVIQLAVGPEGKEFPEVAWLILRIETVDYDLGFRRVVQAVLATLSAGDAGVLGGGWRAPAEERPLW